MAGPSRDSLHFSSAHAEQMYDYLPPRTSSSPLSIPKPFVTLTFATSLDSQLALAPGVQTALSGPESKAMTHYLRSKHDAILIGAGTAVADNPSLNCRIEGTGGYGGDDLTGQPRPIVIDPKGRWQFTRDSKVMKLAKDGRGKAPWVVTQKPLDQERSKILEDVGGKVIDVSHSSPVGSPISWDEILRVLTEGGTESVMIEGGGGVINELLSYRNFHLVDSVIVTIAPVWLGRGGVQVCPAEYVEEGQKLPVGRLKSVKWIPLGEDVVLCGYPIKR